MIEQTTGSTNNKRRSFGQSVLFGAGMMSSITHRNFESCFHGTKNIFDLQNQFACRCNYENLNACFFIIQNIQNTQ